MPGGSIYVQQDEKFTGSSPQWWYEKLFREDLKNRQRSRAIKAGVGLVAGLALAFRFDLPWPPAVALLCAGLAAALDWGIVWYNFNATSVWRGRRRGEVITQRKLKRGLDRAGYRILQGRAIRGQASIDHLVIGPGGVWIVDNESWSPDTDIAAYGGRLFIGEKYGSQVAKPLVATAQAFAELLGKETGIALSIQPMLAVHCGTLPRGGVVNGEGLTLVKPSVAARVIKKADRVVLSDEQIELLARTAARELARRALL
ncbi:nuclease-related domain-containing protein [Nonomuraea sp. NPDC059194]|uniref:nuclease-related domain-containing protein n=1 Tax=Nonomuraea sp. NPDC059194 TaxID=3346764 RepID=UPI00368EFD9D